VPEVVQPVKLPVSKSGFAGGVPTGFGEAEKSLLAGGTPTDNGPEAKSPFVTATETGETGLSNVWLAGHAGNAPEPAKSDDNKET